MHFEIIVGSVLGASEYVADAVDAFLLKKNHTCQIHLNPTLKDIPKDNTWIIICSTHGAGELPENIQPFANELDNCQLTNQFLVIGLGDISYDTFCQGSITMQEKLEIAGAKIMISPLHIDVLNHPVPEEYAIEWLNENFAALK
ncbi:MAG: flavodoxin domain-containing protein [Pseudomonadota bacterium]